VPILNAGCWIIRQSALAKTGFFDEDMFLYGEEYDMCTRMKRAGWEIWFLREVEIIHYRRRSIRQMQPAADLSIYLQSNGHLAKEAPFIHKNSLLHSFSTHAIIK